jgi:hypothetical protein
MVAIIQVVRFIGHEGHDEGRQGFFDLFDMRLDCLGLDLGTILDGGQADGFEDGVYHCHDMIHIIPLDAPSDVCDWEVLIEHNVFASVGGTYQEVGSDIPCIEGSTMRRKNLLNLCGLDRLGFFGV